MTILLYIICVVMLVYCIFIAYITFHIKLPAIQKLTSKSRVTIIIPCRNEAATIGYCLEAIVKQTLSGVQFDVIVVDDFSEDMTINIAGQFSRKLPLTILKNTLPGKKNALTLGIGHATTDIIITTDADCTMGPDWLTSMLNEFETKQLNMLCGLVNFNQSETRFEQLQQTESAAIIGISAVMLNKHKPATCNEANLMFRKSVFDKIGGYGAHKFLASGDDDLLMHAFYQLDAAKVRYTLNKRTVVFTKACTDFNEFLHQRIRWLAKRKYYIYAWNGRMQLLILSQLIAFYCLLLYSFFAVSFVATILIVLKYIVDMLYGRKLKLIFNFNFYQIVLMPFFESYIFLVLLFSRIKKKQWKGRSI